MYAVIESGGKQFRVEVGDTIYVEKLNLENDAEVQFNVLCVGEDGNISLGGDVSAAQVTGKVIKTGKQKKIMVFKYKAKKNYRRRQGHRQPYTKVVIESIKA